MLVNGPCKLIVELPRDKGQDCSSDSDQDWDSNQVWLNAWPQKLTLDQVTWALVAVKMPHCLIDLADLNRRVDEQSEVVETQSNDLNGILEAQGIIDKHKLVQETKDEEGEVGWDDLGLCDGWKAWCERHLKSGENIGLQDENDDGLDDGDTQKGPSPWCVWLVHSESRCLLLLAFGYVGAVVYVFSEKRVPRIFVVCHSYGGGSS